jgi:hypothetical protein
MWNPRDHFYYDIVRVPGGPTEHLRIRSFVGLIPLFAVLAIEPGTLERLPQFRRRLDWYLRYRSSLAGNVCLMTHPGDGGRRLLALADRAKLEAVLPRILDPDQFLSDFGLRSLSKSARDDEFIYHGNRVVYEPAESSTPMFGGNSNWRGPIWFPVNYLMIEALREYHRYFGTTLTVEMPQGGGNRVTLEEVAAQIARRLTRIFVRDSAGRRPVLGHTRLFQEDPHWRDYIPFYEYFHGDNGSGLGASHQTGWTSLVAVLIEWSHAWRGPPRGPVPEANSPSPGSPQPAAAS